MLLGRRNVDEVGKLWGTKLCALFEQIWICISTPLPLVRMTLGKSHLASWGFYFLVNEKGVIIPIS